MGIFLSDFELCIFCLLSSFTVLYRIGVSYYDSGLRQLYVLEVWDDGDKGFPVIDLGMVSFPIIDELEFSFSFYVPSWCNVP